METENLIEDSYRVIEIIDKYSLLINYGTEHGAKEGDKIRILFKGSVVIDPITQELLGTFDFIKDTLTIATTYERFSLCKKIESKTFNTLISPFSQFQTTSKTIEPLTIDETNVSNREVIEDNVIKVGDTIQII